MTEDEEKGETGSLCARALSQLIRFHMDSPLRAAFDIEERGEE